MLKGGNLMKSKELYENIEKSRNKMNYFIELYGEKSDIVLQCSQELDKLILLSYELEKAKTKRKKSVNNALIGVVC